MSGDRLSGLDVAFLCLESPDHPLHMGGVAVFRPTVPVDPHRLVRVLASRAARIPRLRQRVAFSALPPGDAWWQDDPDFDPQRHIQVHKVHGPWQSLAAELMSGPMDRRHPLWQVHVLTGLAGGDFAVLVKLHHAVADGARAMLVGLGLLDHNPALAPVLRQPLPASEPPPRPWELLSKVPTMVGDVLGDLRRGANVATSVLRHARPGLPRSPLLALPSGERSVATVTLPMELVRAARRVHGGTVNDVLLAVVTGALREWHAARGAAPGNLGVRALIPVSNRRRGDADAGNQLSGYLCELPVQHADPSRWVREIRQHMDRNKAAGPHSGAGAIAWLADQVPSAVHRLITPLTRNAAPRLFDVVVTNVPLPSLNLSLDGAPLRELFPLVPLASGHALGIALLTYQHTVHIGLQAHRHAVADLPLLAAKFPRALTALVPDAFTGVPLPHARIPEAQPQPQPQ